MELISARFFNLQWESSLLAVSEVFVVDFIVVSDWDTVFTPAL